MTRSTTAAMADKPGQRTFQEADGAFLAVVRQNFAVGEPAGIVDADMQTLPTDPVMSINRAGAASSHAMADARHPSELLGVEMQQLAQAPALVAHDRRRRVDRLEPVEAKQAQHLGHRRVRHTEKPRDRRRTRPLPPQPIDLDEAFRRRRTQVRGSRAPIQQRGLAARLPAPHPLRNGLFADAEIARHFDNLTRRAIRSRLHGVVRAFWCSSGASPRIADGRQPPASQACSG